MYPPPTKMENYKESDATNVSLECADKVKQEYISELDELTELIQTVIQDYEHFIENEALTIVFFCRIKELMAKMDTDVYSSFLKQENGDVLVEIFVNIDCSSENNTLDLVRNTIIDLLIQISSINEDSINSLSSFFETNFHTILKNDDFFVSYFKLLCLYGYNTQKTLDALNYIIESLRNETQEENLLLKFLSVIPFIFNMENLSDEYTPAAENIIDIIKTRFMHVKSVAFECLIAISSLQWNDVNYNIKMIIIEEEENIYDFTTNDLNKFAKILCNIVYTYRENIRDSENEVLTRIIIKMMDKLTIDIFCSLAPIINVSLNALTPKYHIEELEISDILDFLEDHEDDVPNVKKSNYDTFKTFLEDTLKA